jgi:methionine-gamma-lyase
MKQGVLVMTDSRHQETQVIHAGSVGDPVFGALSTPIHQTSTFVFDSVAQGAARFAGEEDGYVYTRVGNPTVRELERRMAILEGTDDAIATASGMGAISAVLLGLLKAGDHLVTTAELYGCTYALIHEQLPALGIRVTMTEDVSEAALERALTPETRVIFVETPINPGLEVLDLARIARVARLRGITTVVDNTFMTPLLQRPVSLGIDIVVHSATKYLNGHGDVIAGVLCGPAEQVETIRHTTIKNIGAVLSPHDAWLVLRGLKTLSVRMERHLSNAETVAHFLEHHPQVRCVSWPGLASHPGFHLMGSQMKGGGAVISFELNGDFASTVRFMDTLQLCRRAVSLGDIETLIQHPASMTHATYEPEARRAAGISDTLVRIAVGLEYIDDIIDDLSLGLDTIDFGCGPLEPGSVSTG